MFFYYLLYKFIYIQWHSHLLWVGYRVIARWTTSQAPTNATPPTTWQYPSSPRPSSLPTNACPPSPPPTPFSSPPPSLHSKITGQPGASSWTRPCSATPPPHTTPPPPSHRSPSRTMAPSPPTWTSSWTRALPVWTWMKCWSTRWWRAGAIYSMSTLTLAVLRPRPPWAPRRQPCLPPQFRRLPRAAISILGRKKGTKLHFSSPMSSFIVFLCNPLSSITIQCYFMTAIFSPSFSLALIQLLFFLCKLFYDQFVVVFKEKCMNWLLDID